MSLEGALPPTIGGTAFGTGSGDGCLWAQPAAGVASPLGGLPLGISVCTWNVQALFQSVTHSQRMARKKMAILTQLMLRFSVTCLQELHGVAADCDRLLAEMPRGRVFGSIGANPAIGGVAILVTPNMVDKTDEFEDKVLVEGRLHYLDMLVRNCRYSNSSGRSGISI